MRIQFKRVKYKNLLSSGNVFTTIDLDSEPTTLISGSNGSGKSSLLDAIVFGLYGKPFRKINKPQLINSINQKDMLVEIDFTVGGSAYKVRRGIKPTVFEIFKDEELINQDSAARDYQTFLEQSILGINYKSFNQIIILGSATYVPFMELPAWQRREIIEDLLDIQVFSTMGLLAKDRMNENKLAVNDNSYSIDMLQTKLDAATEHNESVREIRQVFVSQIKEKMKSHIEKIEGNKEVINNIQSDIEALIGTIADKQSIKEKLTTLKELQRDAVNKLRAVEKSLVFYHDNDNCPTCKQGIDHDFKDDVTKQMDREVVGLRVSMVALADKEKTLQSRIDAISDVEDQIKTLNLQISENRGEINIAKRALTSYKAELDSAEQEVEDIDLTKIQDLQSKMAILQAERKELVEDQATLAVISTILKDGGIKARIIAQYIPVMNKLINKYLAAFDLFVDFQLDENFDEVIKSRFRDTFSYASFSEGEKLRITLSIMLAWRAVAKLRNSVSTNLLILDETLDGALDGIGIEHLIETLQTLNNDDNIFVISHRGEQFAEKFAAHLKFHKLKNFSEIAA